MNRAQYLGDYNRKFSHEIIQKKAQQGNLMVCYEDSDVAAQTLALAQAYAKSWQVTIDVVSTFKRETPLQTAQVQKMEQDFRAQIEEQNHPFFSLLHHQLVRQYNHHLRKDSLVCWLGYEAHGLDWPRVVTIFKFVLLCDS